MSRPPRPHPLARAPLVDRLNGWLEAAWRAGWCSRPPLDPDALWAKACRTAPATGEHGGRNVEDAADFRVRLSKLCEALENEAALNPLGLTMAHGQLVRVVRQRLRLGALWQARPELTAMPLSPAILVVGQMRGGTTRIHRLLAADPAHTATRFCDSWHPLPPGSALAPDLRPLSCALMLTFARRLDPWLDTIHPFGTTRADEELGWLAASLSPCAYEAQWRVPTFTRWSEARDPAPVYREFARILATDAAHHGNAGQPRVLKVPQFAEDLPALLAQFPLARVVVARRDPEDVVRSAASLVANQMAMQSDGADLAWIEAECRRKVALREQRVSQTLGDVKGPLAEVEFAELDRDWESAIAGIYRQLKLPLTPAALAAMHAEQGRAARSPHAAHAQVYRRFARA
jgi:hypothetical protein